MRGTIPVLLLVLIAGCGHANGEPERNLGPLSEREPNDVAVRAQDIGPDLSRSIVGAISRTASKGGVAVGDRDHYLVPVKGGGLLLLLLTCPEGSDFDLARCAADGRRMSTSRSGGRYDRLLVPVRKDENVLIVVEGYSGAPGAYRLDLHLVSTPGGASGRYHGKMLAPRCFHASAALPDGRVLVAGGTAKATSRVTAFLHSTNSTEIFDPKVGTFRMGPRLGGNRFGPTATVLPDGRVLLAGGDLAGTADLFDPGQDDLVKKRIPLAHGTRVLHRATLLRDGRVLLTGGFRILMEFPPRAEGVATTEIFDPKTLSFTKGPDLRSVRTSHDDCMLRDGRVLVTGGVNRDDCEIVDCSGETPLVLPGPSLTQRRDDHSATTLLDGRVLLAGGQTPGGRGLFSAEILDDAGAGPSSSFRLLDQRMAVPRSDHQAILLRNGMVLLLGGEADPGNRKTDVILKAVEVFDPRTHTFRRAPDLNERRDDHRAVVFPDGMIFVTGGEDVKSNSIATAEAYDPDSAK